jgi:hypothetical protein
MAERRRAIILAPADVAGAVAPNVARFHRRDFGREAIGRERHGLPISPRAKRRNIERSARQLN